MGTVLLVTLFTTLVTVIQTVLMWYFTKHVELDEEELVPVEFATKDYVDERFHTVHEAFNVQSECLEALDEDVAELLNSRRAIKERVDALQELSDALLDAIEGVDANITELQAAEAHRTLKQETATEIMASMEHATPFVYPAPPEIEPTRGDRPPIRSTRPGPTRQEPARRMIVPEELLMDTDDPVQERVNDLPDPEPAIDEVHLKPIRQEGDPMITDLRAEAFEEHTDAYGNIHDLQSGADFELWGEGKGRGRTRDRGFRRI